MSSDGKEVGRLLILVCSEARSFFAPGSSLCWLVQEVITEYEVRLVVGRIGPASRGLALH